MAYDAGPPNVPRAPVTRASCIGTNGRRRPMAGIHSRLAEHVSSNLIAAACIVLAMSAYWLWIDYIHTPPSQD